VTGGLSNDKSISLTNIILYDTGKTTYDAARKEVPLSNSEEEKLSEIITLIDGIEGTRKREKKSFEVMLREYVLNGLIDEEDAELIQKYREEMLKGHKGGGPVGPSKPMQQGWYLGPTEDCDRWNIFLKKLQDDPGFNDETINEINQSTTKILDSNPDPYDSFVDSRGLVLGHVQSGKTTSFTGLIAKAADAGYKLFIVLAGATNSLRQQTQERLTEQLELSGDLWVALTFEDDFDSEGTMTRSGDFSGYGTSPQELLVGSKPLIAVIKKNGPRMKRLCKWLEESKESGIFANVMTMIVDDEADQASIDSGRQKRTAINQRIGDLLEVTGGAYVGYTATPFANILADPSDAKNSLYPKDFIFSLSRPASYFGPEELFGRRLYDGASYEDADEEPFDMIREIPEDEEKELKHPTKKTLRENWTAPSSKDLPSLRGAVLYFLLASAARRSRNDFKDSSMLIHTTMFVDPQIAMREPVEEILSEFRKKIDEDDSDLLEELEKIWDSESSRVPSDHFSDLEPIEFMSIKNHLTSIAESHAVKVVVDNGRSKDRLKYEKESPQIVIVIGGNTLSRGLTLNGLVVSYFLRTSQLDDSLLQMGRWFGYRPRYQDLPRVWMNTKGEDDFKHLATVEHQIRRDIERYGREGRTPQELATRILNIEGRQPTAKAKLKYSKRTTVGYSGYRGHTWIFNNDSKFLKDNLQAVRELIDKITTEQKLELSPSPKKGREHCGIFKDVPTELIVEFLKVYCIHSKHEEFASETLIKYVEKKGLNDLPTWNVAFSMPKKSSPYELGSGVTVNLVSRSKLNRRETEILDLGTLLDSADVNNSTYDLDLGRMRQSSDPGLLMVYVVDKESKPGGNSTRKVALSAPEHVVGIALELPNFENEGTESYIQARLPLFTEEEEKYLEELENEQRSLEESLNTEDENLMS
tara:strand:+ start:1448 stop:4225 length:2778 start_codon:yes stop_codon:yes gene_type:complete